MFRLNTPPTSMERTRQLGIAASLAFGTSESTRCLQGIFSGCVQYGLERRGVAGKMPGTQRTEAKHADGSMCMHCEKYQEVSTKCKNAADVICTTPEASAFIYITFLVVQ